MRKWLLYGVGLDPINTQIPIDKHFSQHAQRMGGYDEDQYYSDDKTIFEKYFFGFHEGRLENYYDFISKNLPQNITVLSLASGRGILEYYLKKNGYPSIDCSDLERSASCKKLGLNFFEFNILESPSKESYDAVLCLGLIYLFDENDLTTFFENVRNKLKSDGILIMDTGGSSDTFFSHFVNEICLYVEIWIYRLYKSMIQRKWYYIETKHLGYRWTDEEVIAYAKKSGFSFDCQANYNYLSDFRRSMIFRKLIKEGSAMERIAGAIIGKRLPYCRLFKFHKIE